jgi:hypothetical protein
MKMKLSSLPFTSTTLFLLAGSSLLKTVQSTGPVELTALNLEKVTEGKTLFLMVRRINETQATTEPFTSFSFHLLL